MRARNEVTIERASAARRSPNSGITPDGRDHRGGLIGRVEGGEQVAPLGTWC